MDVDAAIIILGYLMFIAGLWILWFIFFGNRDDYSYNLSFSGFLAGFFSFLVAAALLYFGAALTLEGSKQLLADHTKTLTPAVAEASAPTNKETTGMETLP